MAKRLPKRHRVYLSLLGVLAAACLLGGALWLCRGRTEPQGPKYLLRDNGGHPALYTADGAGPLAQYDEIYTRLLPESDALALQQGVPIQDETELQRRLEDYGL